MTKQVMKPRRKAKLPQAPPMESRHKRTLIVVADGARARFFEPRHDMHTLVPAAQADMVGPEKQHRVRRAAEAWLAQHPESARLELSFEVIAVGPGGLLRIADAF